MQPAGEKQGESELEYLKARLAEAEDTLRALREGEVDAIVVEGGAGAQIFALKSAAEPYRLLVEQMREGALTLSGDGTILYCNEAFAKIAGAAASRLTGSSLIELIGLSDFERLAAPGGCPSCEMTLKRAGGALASITASSAPLIFEGQPVISAVITDLTGHQLRLRYEAIVESIDEPVYSLTPELVIESWNPGAEKLHGYKPDEVIGRPLHDLCPPEEYEALLTLAVEVRRTGRPLARDVRRLRKDSSTVHLIFCLAPLLDDGGRLTGYAVISHDITERKAQEKTRQLLLDELNHRVKNTLAMVQSIARLTLRQTKGPEDFAASFTGRIEALASAHDVLTASLWHDADLRNIVRQQLILSEVAGDRFISHGPAVKLDPQTAIALSLVLHELGTNASKYGAFSVASGRVTLSWDLADGGKLLTLRWQEEGGPRAGAPTRRGFGSFIIEQSLSGLNGEVQMRFEPPGLVCDIRLPVAKGKHQAMKANDSQAASRAVG